MEINFCRRCGEKLERTKNDTYECANGHTIYPNPLPTVGIFFVTSDNHVILSKRGIEPHKGMLDSFGGFLDGSETFEEAAQRELHEETNLLPEDYEPLNYLTSAIGHYPYEGETLLIVSTLFWARLLTNKEIMPFDDVDSVVNIPLHEVDPYELHDDDIRAGILELQKLIPNNKSMEVK